MGDYDYGSAILTKHVTSWVDGRKPINGASQQDAFTDRELVGFAVTTTDPGLQQHHQYPACGLYYQPERPGGSGNCSSDRFHGERNSRPIRLC